MNAIQATDAPSISSMEEFRDRWRLLPDKSVFLALLAGWLALFQFYGLGGQGWYRTSSLFVFLWNSYSFEESDYKYAKLVPLAVLALLWHKRERLAASRTGSRWPGLGLLALAAALHLVGFLAQQETLSIVAIFLGIYGLAGATWGWGALKESFFPFFLFGFCVPISSVLVDMTFLMRLLATTLTHFVSHDLLGIPLTQAGTTLLKPDGNAFEIVAACSGLHSFTALLFLTTIYAMVALRGIWTRALIVGLTIPLAIGCNMLRLVAMVVADRAWGRHAGAMVHDSDWIFTYGLAIAAIMLMGQWLQAKESSPAS